MFTIRSLDCKIVFISLCIIHFSTLTEGRPLRKRSVSEAQLMHNVGVHKHVQERQDWLQMKLQDIHTAASRNGERQGDRDRVRTRSLEDLPELKDLTESELEDLINRLEKLLNSKQQ